MLRNANVVWHGLHWLPDPLNYLELIHELYMAFTHFGKTIDSVDHEALLKVKLIKVQRWLQDKIVICSDLKMTYSASKQELNMIGHKMLE